jgi:hypothetical protein
MKPLNLSNDDGYYELDAGHARNFLDCVRSRERPNCDVEEVHRSTSDALLAKIALATKARLDSDSQAERFTKKRGCQRAAGLRISPAVVACLIFSTFAPNTRQLPVSIPEDRCHRSCGR